MESYHLALAEQQTKSIWIVYFILFGIAYHWWTIKRPNLKFGIVPDSSILLTMFTLLIIAECFRLYLQSM